MKLSEQTSNSQSNFHRLMNNFKANFPYEYQSKVDLISDYVENFIKNNNFNIKFLNSCSTGFMGVRTKDQVIICSPTNLKTIGDFIYTIFHELRHEQQVSQIKIPNPIVDMDLDDFEELYKQYWEMELDADQFAKNKIARIILKLKIPIDVAKNQFSLSSYLQNYPLASNMIKQSLNVVINQIKQIKKSGGEFSDIQDHPMIKQYLNKLERFI
jgi:hypothetical protein